MAKHPNSMSASQPELKISQRTTLADLIAMLRALRRDKHSQLTIIRLLQNTLATYRIAVYRDTFTATVMPEVPTAVEQLVVDIAEQAAEQGAEQVAEQGTKPDDVEPDDVEPDDAEPDEPEPDDAEPDEPEPDDAEPDEAGPPSVAGSLSDSSALGTEASAEVEISYVLDAPQSRRAKRRERQLARKLRHAQRAAVRRAPEVVVRIDHQQRMYLDMADQEDSPFDEMGEATRVMLTFDHRRIQGAVIPLCFECSGVVLDARTWNPISQPPRLPNVQAKLSVIEAHIDDYEAIRIGDGTTVTIYPWVPAFPISGMTRPASGVIWCISSIHGYDVSAYRWMGSLTFAEIIHDLATRYYPRFVEATGMSLVRNVMGHGDVRLHFTRLDPGWSHTLWFRHHNFHPLHADPEGMLQVHHVRVGREYTGEFVHRGALEGLPCQEATPVARLLEDFGRQVRQPMTQLAQLGAYCKGALDHAAGALGRGDATAGDFFYGYLFRSAAPVKTGVSSVYLLGSDLLEALRAIVYRPQHQPEIPLDHSNRLEYALLKAHLGVGRWAPRVKDLFPAKHGFLAEWEKLRDEIAESVLFLIREASVTRDHREPPPVHVAGLSRQELFVRTIAAALVAQPTSLNGFDAKIAQTIRDYLTRPEYVAIYVSILTARREAAAADRAAAAGQARDDEIEAAVDDWIGHAEQ